MKKLLGCDIITLDFIIKRFKEDKGKLLVESLKLSVAKGHKFRIASVPVINVTSDSSSRHLTRVSIKD